MGLAMEAKVIPMKPNQPNSQQTPEVPGNETVRSVLRTLESWGEWAGSTDRGILTPYQLLALILWSIQTPKTSAAEESLIVVGWARALLSGMRQGIPALHPVTLLPIEGYKGPLDWVLTVQHAQEFLDSMPVGFDVAIALQHFRDQAAVAKEGVELTLDDAIAQRKGGKNKPWTDSQLEVIGEAVHKQGLQSIAARMELSHQSLSSALKRDRKGRGPVALKRRHG